MAPSLRHPWLRCIRTLLPELALVAATISYGATFKIVQDALRDVTPVGFILLRFTFGAVALAPFALRRGFRRSGVSSAVTARAFAIAVLVFGLVGFAGYWFQNEGLRRTTTSNSAFVTGLFVVFTPIVETLVTRRRPSRRVMAAVAFAVVGLFLLEGASFEIHSGDALTLGCAFMFAVWILLGGAFSQRYDPIALTAAQLGVFAVCAIPVVAIGGLGHVTARVWFAAAFTGVVCSAFAFSLQLWGQRSVEPTRAAVILELEPVVAGIVGYWIGERLGAAGYVGALVILAGILVAESGSWRLDRSVNSPRESP